MSDSKQAQELKAAVKKIMESSEADRFFQAVIEMAFEKAGIHERQPINGMPPETFVEHQIAEFLTGGYRR